VREDVLLYGASGFTGRLVAERAAARGGRPILAGRSEAKVRPLADRLGLSHRVFPLDDGGALSRGLEGVAVVLNCAGPFSRTARPMIEACIRARAHYLDITGEIEVFEHAAAEGGGARDAGVMLMPGVGFDVVPSDCLAAHLKRRLPGAVALTLAFQAVGRPSPGTARTAVEGLRAEGLVRRAGRLVPVPWAHRTRTVDFGRGEVEAMAVPWGDVSTAFHSTGIPDVEVFMAVPHRVVALARAGRHLRWLLRSAPVQAALKAAAAASSPGPGEEERRGGRSFLWGEARDADGRTARARLSTPEAYEFTARTSWEIAARAASGRALPGFRTPSMAFGPDFILEFEGVERRDLD